MNNIKSKLVIKICAMAIMLSAGTALAQVKGKIKGTVSDGNTGEALPFATVYLKDTDPPIGSTTNLQGKFILENVPVGRYNIEFSFTGYGPVIVKEILVSSGKEVVTDVTLHESVLNLDEVVVRPKVNKHQPVNSLSGISTRMLSVEEANRYAGGFDDPARLASSFAGVSSGLQSNGIVVRGNNPQSLLWRMEGVEISNPNHFADQSVFGGGGLTALSSQMLANSDFLTGAFPSSYGNAISGVFDLSMRTGNNDRHEHTFQAGIIGIDASSEGPFKKGGNATYLFNYRYSTLTLIEPLLPDEANGIKYQDLAYKLKLPTKNAGLFSIWGIGLLDQSGQDLKDLIDREYESDQLEQNVDQHMAASGIKHTINMGENMYIESDLAFTSSGLDYVSTRFDDDDSPNPDERIRNKNQSYVFQSQLNSNIGKRLINQTGFRSTILNYNLLLRSAENGAFETIVEQEGTSSLHSIYSHSQVKLSSQLSFLGGINYQYFGLNGQGLVEPRLALKWTSNKRHSIGLAYGLHSRTEKLNYYLGRNELGQELNRSVGLTRAHHFAGCYDLEINENLRLKIEPYYQKLYDVPVINGSAFSFINLKNDWFINDQLVNEGEGRNYGLDITLEKFLNKGYYFMVTSSIFRSEYKGGDGIWRNTAFDRQFIANALFGKEWFVGKSKSNVLGLNLRLNYQGGQPYTPIDPTSSSINMEAIEIDDLAYSSRFDPTVVAHFSASFRINKPKRSSVWTLSVLNASMTREFEDFAYNFQTGQVDEVSEALVIPNLSYKIEF